MTETVLDLADAYSTVSDAGLAAADRAARDTQRATIEMDDVERGEMIYLQQDRVIQAIMLEQSRRRSDRAIRREAVKGYPLLVRMAIGIPALVILALVALPVITLLHFSPRSRDGYWSNRA